MLTQKSWIFVIVQIVKNTGRNFRVFVFSSENDAEMMHCFSIIDTGGRIYMRKRVCEIIAAVFLMLLIVSFAQNLEETDRAVQEAGELSADTVGQFFQMMDMLALQKE